MVPAILLIVVVIPNVYASTDDNPTKFSDEQFKALSDCSKDRYNDGQNNPLISKELKSCDKLKQDTYYLSFINGCKDTGNTEETCKRFTDQ
ncbi:MAG: hypothetical protein ACRD8W_11540 [Nitrososphaeraceae archaeon]